jgi:hypothetical protein
MLIGNGHGISRPPTRTTSVVSPMDAGHRLQRALQRLLPRGVARDQHPAGALGAMASDVTSASPRLLTSKDSPVPGYAHD